MELVMPVGEKKIYPKFEYGKSRSFLVNEIKTIDHPFLQGLIDINAVLTYMQGEFVVMAYESLVMLHIYPSYVEIECITTPVEFRKRGSGSKTMLAMCAIADTTDTVLKLRTADVTGHNFNMLMQHIVVAHGMKKKNKLPVSKLPDWYMKFEFEKVSPVSEYKDGKKQVTGWRMQRLPQRLTEES